MTRKKVTLAYIANDSARKATFKKRKKGLIKKVSELSTLCGIEACAIVYSAYDTEPEVWPSAVGARRAISRFRNMPEMDQSKRMVNQPAFLRQRIGKTEEQLKRQQRENREKEVTQVMYRALTGLGPSLQGLNLLDLNDLGWVVEKTVREIEDKMKSMNKSPPPPPRNNNNNDSNNSNSTRVSQAHQGSTDQTNNSTEREVKGINSALDDVAAMDAGQNQPWYMELLKPSDGLMGFSRFNNSNYNNNNNDLMIPQPHPHLPPPPPPYPCPSQNLNPWSNFFIP